MKEDILTDEQWLAMYTDVGNHQFGKFESPQPQVEEIIDLVDEVTEVVDNTQLISDMIAEELGQGEITEVGDFESIPLANEDDKPIELTEEKPKRAQLSGKTRMYLRCTNEDCTSTPRLVNFAAGCKLPRDCNICNSTLKLGKE